MFLINSIISQDYVKKKHLRSRVDHFFKENKISKLLKQSNFYKQKGIPCADIFRFIFMLVFTGKNLFCYLLTQIVNETHFVKIPFIDF